LAFLHSAKIYVAQTMAAIGVSVQLTDPTIAFKN